MGGGLAKEEFLSVREAIRQAPFESQGWDRALKAIAARTWSSCGELVVFGRNHTIDFNWMTDRSETAHREFIEIGAGSPDVNWRVAASGAPLKIVGEAEYDAIRGRMSSEPYDAWVERHDLEYGCQAMLHSEPNLMVGLAVVRARREGRTRFRDRQRFAELAPHVLASVRLQRALQDQGAAMIAGTFDALSVPALIVDGRGIVRARSDAAEQLLSRERRIGIRNSQLTAVVPADDRRLQSAFARVLGPGQEDGPRIAGIVLRDQDDAGTTLLVHVFALPEQDWALGLGARAVVTLRRAFSQEAASLGMLTDLFELTPAEAEVAQMLSMGFSREKIAACRRTSVGTVTVQVKSVFRKVGVVREAELVATLNHAMRWAPGSPR